MIPFFGYGYGKDRSRDRGPRLQILGATYRSVDGRACNAFSYAHRKCDGDKSCTVKASNKICGDPDRGRLKVLKVTYACGSQQYTVNTQNGPAANCTAAKAEFSAAPLRQAAAAKKTDKIVT